MARHRRQCLSTRREKDYAATFASNEGKRVLEDLKKLSYFYSTTLHEHPTVMAHREGRRALVVAILQAIEAAGIPEPKEQPPTDE